MPRTTRPGLLALICLVMLAAGIVRAQDEDEAATKPSPTTVKITLGDSPAILKAEFVFETAPFPSCHASTIAQTKKGLIAAWFGGTHERAPDVGIWVAGWRDGAGWSKPVEVANGYQPFGPRLPTWNPVLYQPRDGRLTLFYKVGPSPSTWWGMRTTSADAGASWTAPTKLPDGILGPIKNKPICLSDGSLLCPSSVEGDPMSGTTIHMEFTSDLGATWSKTPPLSDSKIAKLIQPTVLDHGQGTLQALCRSKGYIYQCWSHDNGKTWSEPRATLLPCPGSGIDAVQLKDGRSLLAFNNSATARHPLCVVVSPDGSAWGEPVIIEDTDGPQLSYPAVIQTDDGLVHLTYTWLRKRIRHVVLDPARLH